MKQPDGMMVRHLLTRKPDGPTFTDEATRRPEGPTFTDAATRWPDGPTFIDEATRRHGGISTGEATRWYGVLLVMWPHPQPLHPLPLSALPVDIAQHLYPPGVAYRVLLQPLVALPVTLPCLL